MHGQFYGVQARIKQKGQGYDRVTNIHSKFCDVQAHINAEMSEL